MSLIKLNTPRDEGAQYGWVVDMSGDFLAVGGPGYYHDTGNERYRCGTVLLFQKQADGEYSFVQRLLPPDPSIRGFFGGALAIDGYDLIIGDEFDKLDTQSVGGYDSAGAVYAYRYDPKAQEWIFVNKIVKKDRTDNDRFGKSLALEDGLGVITTGGKDLGEIFFIKKDKSGGWTIFKLYQDGFMNVRDVDIDGDELIFAVDGQFAKAPMSNKWEVVTASLDSSGHLSKFSPVRPERDFKGRTFGFGGLKIAGNYCFVNSFYKPENGGEISNRGNVHLFERKEKGEWVEIQKIVSPDKNKVDFFGSSLDYDDGTLVVGAMGHNYNDDHELVPYRGAAYVYELEADSLIFKMKIAAPNKEWNKFGFSVSVESGFALVGSRLESYADSVKNAGGAYLYDLNN
ncbi:MAG: FG-GAP repeat protein [Bacteroidota bacterium]